MNFLEAFKVMNEGKKVHRTSHDNLKGLYLGENKYVSMDYPGDMLCRSTKYAMAVLKIEDVEATDWEIFEEKKTLSDKMHTIDFTSYGTKFDGKVEIGLRSLTDWMDSTDVKEAIKEFFDYIPEEPHHIKATLKNKAKEIFGEKLI